MGSGVYIDHLALALLVLLPSLGHTFPIVTVTLSANESVDAVAQTVASVVPPATREEVFVLSNVTFPAGNQTTICGESLVTEELQSVNFTFVGLNATRQLAAFQNLSLVVACNHRFVDIGFSEPPELPNLDFSCLLLDGGNASQFMEQLRAFMQVPAEVLVWSYFNATSTVGFMFVGPNAPLIANAFLTRVSAAQLLRFGGVDLQWNGTQPSLPPLSNSVPVFSCTVAAGISIAQFTASLATLLRISEDSVVILGFRYVAVGAGGTSATPQVRFFYEEALPATVVNFTFVGQNASVAATTLGTLSATALTSIGVSDLVVVRPAVNGPTAAPVGSSSSSRTLAIVLGSVGGALLLAGIAVAVVVYRRKHRLVQHVEETELQKPEWKPEQNCSPLRTPRDAPPPKAINEMDYFEL